MALGWMDDVRQTAVIDEAEKAAVAHLQKPFEEARALYAEVDFDLPAWCVRVGQLAALARIERGAAQSAQAFYEVESGESRSAVDEVGRWLKTLRLAAKRGIVEGHPRGAGLLRLFGTETLTAHSWSTGMDSMNEALLSLDKEPLPGLPKGHGARGLALIAKLRKESSEATLAGNTSRLHSARLEALLDAIVHEFERLNAARDQAMDLSGKDIPGLELALVKGAAASSSAEPSAPAAPPTDVPPTTGL